MGGGGVVEGRQRDTVSETDREMGGGGVVWWWRWWRGDRHRQ